MQHGISAGERRTTCFGPTFASGYDVPWASRKRDTFAECPVRMCRSFFMLTLYTTALANANEYARQRGSELLDRLGYGQDGIVYSTNQKSAVKAFRYDEQYRREKEVYGRIQKQNISKVGEFAIPRPISYHDKLMVIEMEIVSPPFIVDFAGAYLDEAPPYPPDVLAEWERRKRQLFGRRWPVVRSALSQLRGDGIHLADINPGNVTF
jgi:hypothetical protein